VCYTVTSTALYFLGSTNRKADSVQQSTHRKADGVVRHGVLEAEADELGGVHDGAAHNAESHEARHSSGDCVGLLDTVHRQKEALLEHRARRR